MYGNNHTLIASNYFNVLEIYESIEFIRGEVIFYNKWNPKKADKLEFQDENYRGLFWWYNKILTEIASENKQNTK